jgi:hypothetical protein
MKRRRKKQQIKVRIEDRGFQRMEQIMKYVSNWGGGALRQISLNYLEENKVEINEQSNSARMPHYNIQ